jgi:glycosyltransferase involved in cell wall biosynthesis
MKVLLVHNHYQQSGGEDAVFAAEGRLLESHDECVIRYTAHNDDVSALSRLALARSTVWNQQHHHALRDVLRRERPDVMHVHNTLPLISPAAYYAARAEQVPVVQTLHNYRLLCPSANFLRDGKVCEDCLGKSLPYPGMVHRCYRGSLAASGAVVAALAIHRALGTWTDQVDLFIALTEFAKWKHVEGGLPEERFFVKPQFVESDSGPGDGEGGYALYVGRLSEEKGVHVLLAAWADLGDAMPLKVVGDGPLSPAVAEAARRPGIEWHGRQPPDVVQALMKRATVLVVPSVCYEGFPLVIVEAFAAGLPVITSDIGSPPSLVGDGMTGLHFRSGDPLALAARVRWASTHAGELAAMRPRARHQYEARYTADRNYDLLMLAYESASAHARTRTR